MAKRKTQQEFIAQAHELHSDKYDYSKVIYGGSYDPVIITCPIHGDFEQKPVKHLSGHGCHECGKDKMSEVNAKSQDTFIAEAAARHKGRYDYSKVVYIGSRDKIIIICPEHGEFPQIAGDHLDGHGCYECGLISQGLPRRMSFEAFVKKANKVHKGKYTYYPECYSSDIITIRCPIHGDFPQKRGVHLRGHGCQSCANCKPLTVSDVIVRSKSIHGDLYDYTSLTEIGENKIIQVICRKHGIFPTNANDHMSGHGCYRCGVEQNANRRRKTLEDFIKQANIIHEGIYDYSLVEYINTQTKVIIICSKHGTFRQEPNNHLDSHGCPSCSHFVSKPEIRWLDSLGITDRQHTIKIGSNRYKVDGYDPDTNTVYEFYGDFWHGNPCRFDPNDINGANHKTFGELYAKTLKKEDDLKQAGYNVVSIWETDFLAQANIAA